MVAFFRQFLVVLLVLLQYAAPLVHAHTGKDGSQNGIHLYEFETVRFVSDHVSMSGVFNETDAESIIVNVGSAIEQQQSCKQLLSVFCLQSGHSALPDVKPADTVNFCPPQSDLVFQPIISQNATRAPPF